MGYVPSCRKDRETVIKVVVDAELSERYPGALLGCIQCRVEVKPSPDGLLRLLDETCERLHNTIALDEIIHLPAVEATRACYKALGKDPHRYRNSAEAMLRRVVQGKGLYRINNVVDVNNLLSIQSGCSLGTYDISVLHAPVLWTRSPEGTHYRGIGKEQVNIEFLPALRDTEGFFGNPTSDCQRAMITETAQEILLCVYGFCGREMVESVMEQGTKLLDMWCGGREFETAIIG